MDRDSLVVETKGQSGGDFVQIDYLAPLFLFVQIIHGRLMCKAPSQIGLS